MPDLLFRDARLLTLSGARPRRGAAHAELTVIERGWLRTAGEQIAELGAGDAPPARARERVVEASGRVLMPGFVDAHTHACWAGERLDEWELKQRGASYLELLEAGGGIMSTVRATREAGRAQLAELLGERLDAMLAGGTTSVEVKSGYGLSTEHELEMLRAIHDVSQRSAVTVVPTACIGHAVDKQHPGGAEGFVETTIRETLSALHETFPGVTLDAYCEQGAWSLEDCLRLFRAGAELGHPFRVHSDQFNELGMTRAAIELGARSVDHLEATSVDPLRELAASASAAVMLPCSGFHTDGRYADGRALIDAGGWLVVASNYNPGSSPCHSLPMAIALAVRELGVTAAEAICATTLNAAELLGLTDRGSLGPGQRADLVLLRHRDERMLGYEFGGNPVELVVCGGEVV